MIRNGNELYALCLQHLQRLVARTVHQLPHTRTDAAGLPRRVLAHKNCPERLGEIRFGVLKMPSRVQYPRHAHVRAFIHVFMITRACALLSVGLSVIL